MKWQVIEAFDLLERQLGDVEDRFIHLRMEGDRMVMSVVREETEGRALPDVSSFAALRTLREMLHPKDDKLARLNARAKALWAA